MIEGPGGHTEHKFTKNRLAILICLLVLLPITAFTLWKFEHGVTEENHILESAQAVFLLFSCFIHSRNAIRARSLRVEPLLFIGLALFTLSLVLRELDIDKIGPSSGWDTLQFVLRSIVVAFWVIFGLYLLPRLKELWRAKMRLLVMPVITLTAFGCCFYFASWFFDKEVFDLPKAPNKLIEQTLQLNACFVIFFASLQGRTRYWFQKA